MKIFNEVDIPFEEFPDVPEIVYKYRRWEDDLHKTTITKNNIYFSSPKDLGDPDECRIPFRFDLVDDETWIRFQRRIIRESNPLMTDDEIDQKISGEINTNMDIRINEEWQDKWKKDTYELRDKYLGVFCVTISPTNYQMWEDRKFGFYNKGFCIGFNPPKMFPKQESFGACLNVSYYPTGNPPIVLPIRMNPNHEETRKKYFLEIYNLKDSFSYQEEFRFTKSYPQLYKPTREFTETEEQEIRTVNIPSEAYEEIIFGSKMSQTKKMEIYNLALPKYPNVKFFDAIRDKENRNITLRRFNPRD